MRHSSLRDDPASAPVRVRLLADLQLSLSGRTSPASGVAGRRAAAGPPATTGSDEVWITLGADAFVTASRLFVAGADGPALARVAEFAGVVLTRVPRAGLPALSARIHDELRRCGGFIAHEVAPRPRPRWRASPPRPTARRTVRCRSRSTGRSRSQRSRRRSTRRRSSPLSPPCRRASPIAITPIRRGRRPPTGSAISGPATPPVAPRSPSSSTRTARSRRSPPSSRRSRGRRSATRSSSSARTRIRSGRAARGNPICDAPGADDDASGIATLSEVLRVRARGRHCAQRTVQFIAYAAEEVGLEGSDDIAADYFAAGIDVVAVLQQDMTGYNGSVEDMALDLGRTHPDLTAFLGALLDAYQPDAPLDPDGVRLRLSDHAPWTSHRYRAAFSFEPGSGDRGPTIHTPATPSRRWRSAASAAKFARLAALPGRDHARRSRASSATASRPATSPGGLAAVSTSRRAPRSTRHARRATAVFPRLRRRLRSGPANAVAASMFLSHARPYG